MLKKKGVDIESDKIYPGLKYGSYIKRRVVQKDTGNDKSALRHEYTVFHLPKITCDDVHLSLLFAKDIPEQKVD